MKVPIVCLKCIDLYKSNQLLKYGNGHMEISSAGFT